MPGIMGDHDIEGQFEELLRILKSPTWSDLWEKLGFTTEKFATLGLSVNAADVVVWETCQAHQVVLVTGNRNDDGPDSLEATIRRLNQADSLPVITISKPQEVVHRSYAERAAVRLLDYLMELDKYRGAGRLYIP
jgi:hypothetical protein